MHNKTRLITEIKAFLNDANKLRRSIDRSIAKADKVIERARLQAVNVFEHERIVRDVMER